MKKVLTLILTLSLLLCPLGVSAAEPELQTAYGYAKLLNFGEFPEKPEYEAGIATASIPQYNSAAGATDSTSKSALQEIHEYLRDNMMNCEQTISVENYNLSVAELKKTFTETTNYYPELFHVNNRYYYSPPSNNIVSTLYPEYVNPDNRSYIYTEDEQAAAKAAYDTALKKYNDDIDRIIGGIAPEMSNLEKALYVHDYLVMHFQYDLRLYSKNPSEKAEKVHDVYGFFNQHVGVCQAYTQAFNAIMHRLGIECTSALNDTEEHTWNIITLNGNNYHIDATQDDFIYKLDENTYVNQSDGFANHNFFLLSDNTIKNTTFHSDWYSAVYNASCTDKTYESGYAWNEADSSFEYVDGKWYYITYASSNISKLYRTNDFSANEAIYDINMFNSSETSYFPAYLGGLTSFGNVLYFTTPFKIYYYDTLKSYGDVFMTASENYISSCRYDGTEEDGYFILTVFHGSHPLYSDLPSNNERLAVIDNADGSKDGKVDAVDITYTKQYLLGTKTDFNWATIDFGNKKQVSILDLVKIKKIAS